jgi:hypothetical protein
MPQGLHHGVQIEPTEISRRFPTFAVLLKLHIERLSLADNLDLCDAGPPKRFERVVYMRHFAVEFSAIN